MLSQYETSSMNIDPETQEIVSFPSDLNTLDNHLIDSLLQVVGLQQKSNHGVVVPIWKESGMTDGFIMKQANLSGSPIQAIYTSGLIPCSLDQIREVLADVGNIPIYNPRCQNVEVVHRFSQNRTIIHATIAMPRSVFTPWLQDRDFVWYNTDAVLSNGMYVSVARSCRWPGHNQSREQQIRGTILCSGFVVVPTFDPHQCVLHYVAQADPRGSLPAALVNLLGGEQAQAPLCIWDYLSDKYPTEDSKRPHFGKL